MTDDPRLSRLLVHWQEMYEHGRDIAAKELCRDCPELGGELDRRIAIVRHLAALALRGDVGAGAETASQAPATGIDEFCGGAGPAAGASAAEYQGVLAPPQPVGELVRLGQFALRSLLGRG